VTAGIGHTSSAVVANLDAHHRIPKDARDFGASVIAATPNYKAGISSLFKSFVDLPDNALLVAKPVAIAAAKALPAARC